MKKIDELVKMYFAGQYGYVSNKLLT